MFKQTLNLKNIAKTNNLKSLNKTKDRISQSAMSNNVKKKKSIISGRFWGKGRGGGLQPKAADFKGRHIF